MVGNLQTYQLNHHKKKNSKDLELITKTENIKIYIDSKIDHNEVAKLSNFTRNVSLKKLTNNSTTPNKKKSVSKNKIQPNKMEIKGDNKESK